LTAALIFSSPPSKVVRSVCANSCGCDTSAAIEEAVQFTASQTTADDEDCVDTLANHPSCTFGGLCDCEAFVESPESTGCGGVYASAMGDVKIDSVCNKYCGCTATSSSANMMEESMDNSAALPTQAEPSPTSGSGDCINALVNNPTCRFGGLYVTVKSSSTRKKVKVVVDSTSRRWETSL